jgi:preprotein translocase subunit SecG
MQTVIIIVHLIIVLALVGVVLLQRSEGGIGMGSGGGTSGFMTGRGQANALTRATGVLAALFFATSLVLAIMAGYNRGPRSILDGAAPINAPAGAPAAPAQGGPGVLEQLQQLQGGQQPAAPGAPPAAPQVPQSR